MDEEPDKIAALIAALHHPEKKVIRQAAEALISMAAVSPELVERLRLLLIETPAERRWPFGYVLAHLPPLSPECLNALTHTLESEDPDLRWATAVLLARLGKTAPGVTARLIGILKSGAPTQRRMAVYCLRDIGATDALSHQALLDALRDPEPLVRVAALTSLKGRPRLVQNELEFLLRLLREDPDSRIRYSAALVLAKSAAPTDEIRAALQEASRSGDALLKKAANAALRLLQKKGPASSAE